MTADSNVLTFPPPRPASRPSDEALLGPSPAIARVWSQIHRVAAHFRAALITGEPGCGAEAAARSLHALSPTGDLPFFTLDAARAELLFAAPPDAIRPSSEGLLFIPDVHELSAAAQRGLLRKLRTRGRERFRVVAGSTSDLRATVSAGRFSAPLAELLGTVRIALPPLRERPEDLPLLATQMVQRLADRHNRRTPALAASFHDAAAEFRWPGNLTQLEQLLDYLLIHTTADTYTATLFATAAATFTATPAAAAPPVRMIRLEDIVQEHIRAVLIGCDGNKLRAAEVLGISRSTLYRMLDGGVPNRHFSLAG